MNQTDEIILRVMGALLIFGFVFGFVYRFREVRLGRDRESTIETVIASFGMAWLGLAIVLVTEITATFMFLLIRFVIGAS